MTPHKTSGTQELVAYIDGACRGNPGPAAAAAVLISGGAVVAERARFLGTATNNRAEYEALILALETAAELGASSVSVFTDSELIARQVRGEYKIKNTALKPLNAKVKELASRFAGFAVREIPREKNVIADGLANSTLDAHADIRG